MPRARAARDTLPLLASEPYGQRLTLWLAPGGSRRALVRWNGEPIADIELTGWTRSASTCQTSPSTPTIESPRRPLSTRPGRGVAVGDLEIEFLRR